MLGLRSRVTTDEGAPGVRLGTLGFVVTLAGLAILVLGRLLDARSVLEDYVGGIVVGVGFTVAAAGLLGLLFAHRALEASARRNFEAGMEILTRPSRADESPRSAAYPGRLFAEGQEEGASQQEESSRALRREP
jgi:hypothetical protein